MKHLFLIFSIAFLALLVFALGLLYVYPKLELHLLLNSYHTSGLDTFFKYYSFLAEGPLYVIALLPVFWKKVRLSVFFALCELTGSAIIQILKHIFGMPRPSVVFEGHPDMVLPVVDGVNLLRYNSFPSGHSFTFFAFSTCCALLLSYHYRQKFRRGNFMTKLLLGVVMLLPLTLAALGGYSRIYLSQHFLSDVIMGSFLGFVMVCLLFYFSYNKLLKINLKEIE